MKKSKALEMFGGGVADTATALGISYQAVSKWPDELPQRIADRVLGAYVRIHRPGQSADPAPTPPDAPHPAEQGVA